LTPSFQRSKDRSKLFAIQGPTFTVAFTRAVKMIAFSVTDAHAASETKRTATVHALGGVCNVALWIS